MDKSLTVFIISSVPLIFLFITFHNVYNHLYSENDTYDMNLNAVTRFLHLYSKNLHRFIIILKLLFLSYCLLILEDNKIEIAVCRTYVRTICSLC